MEPEERDRVPLHPSERHFESEVEKKEARKIRARGEGERSIWFGLGMMGLVGWSVAIPALIGVAVGMWIDSVSQSQYSWTLMCLIFGVILGCWNAWYWVQRHSRQD